MVPKQAEQSTLLVLTFDTHYIHHFNLQPIFYVFVFQETVSEGPVPLCSVNSVSFVAEQVSHHPPSKYWIILGWYVVEAFTLMC